MLLRKTKCIHSKKILNEKTFNRFDKLLTIQPDLFSDTMLCSAIPGKEAIANELEPSQDLLINLRFFMMDSYQMFCDMS